MNRSDDVDVLDPDRLLREWRWLCPQRVTIIDRNAYGDLFLRDELGRVHKLDVGSGEFALVAGSTSEFEALRNTLENPSDQSVCRRSAERFTGILRLKLAVCSGPVEIYEETL